MPHPSSPRLRGSRAGGLVSSPTPHPGSPVAGKPSSSPMRDGVTVGPWVLLPIVATPRRGCPCAAAFPPHPCLHSPPIAGGDKDKPISTLPAQGLFVQIKVAPSKQAHPARGKRTPTLPAALGSRTRGQGSAGAWPPASLSPGHRLGLGVLSARNTPPGMWRLVHALAKDIWQRRGHPCSLAWRGHTPATSVSHKPPLCSHPHRARPRAEGLQGLSCTGGWGSLAACRGKAWQK